MDPAYLVNEINNQKSNFDPDIFCDPYFLISWKNLERLAIHLNNVYNESH